jgi:hypothetical protein
MLHIIIRLKYLIFLFSCGLFWQGCNVINPHEQTPTYIHIDSFQFVNNASLVHSLTASHQINIAWVYYNNSPVGVFDLPATIPVIARGTGTLEIFPGVVINGQNNLTGVYPFYVPDTSLTFTAQPGKIINYTPKTKFYTTTKIFQISDFSGNTNFALASGNIPIVSVSADSLSFEGRSGMISLIVPGIDSSEDSSIYRFPIPRGNAFIEFDYKCSIPFYVGLQSNLASEFYQKYYLAGIYPSSNNQWQKFYLSVSNFVAQYTGDTYNLYIKASIPSGPAGKVLLDNIQLVTF